MNIPAQQTANTQNASRETKQLTRGQLCTPVAHHNVVANKAKFETAKV